MCANVWNKKDPVCRYCEDHYENVVRYFGKKKINKESVSIGVFEQVKWERDVAIQQLKELGYGLGEKIRTDEDCISREAVIEILSNYGCTNKEGLLFKDIRELPSVKPKEITGEWQQDMDGTFLCSECGSGYKDQPTLMGKPMFAFCPICGAKMTESEDKE